MCNAAFRVTLAFLLLLIAIPAFAGKKAPRAILCSGQKAGDAIAREVRRGHEESRFHAFAASLLGWPTSCVMTESTFDERRFLSVAYRYAKKGPVLSLQSLPPETSIQELEIPGGFATEKEARDFLEKTAKEAGFEIDWGKAPERETKDGRVRSSWWDPDQGLNASATMIRTTGGSLVAIRLSSAL